MTSWELNRSSNDIPEVELTEELTPGEIASLYRRRAEGEMRNLKGAAQRMGISHPTLIGRETDTQGDPFTDVIPWWERYFNLEE